MHKMLDINIFSQNLMPLISVCVCVCVCVYSFPIKDQGSIDYREWSKERLELYKKSKQTCELLSCPSEDTNIKTVS